MAKRLLVVDDALIIRELVKDAVSNGGWEVCGEASDGRQAVEQYRSLRPDAVTLDLVMPEYDGLYALRHIREFDSAARVLVVSAIDQTDTLKEALTAGAADFIVKPFDGARVVQALDCIMRSTLPETDTVEAPAH